MQSKWAYIPSLSRNFLFYLFIGAVNEFFALNMIFKSNHEALYDIGINILPRVDPFYCDFVLVLLGLYFTIRWLYKDPSKISEFLYMMSWIFVVRFISFTITSVPSSGDCVGRLKESDPIRWNIVAYLLFHHQHACYDLMFSGHSAHAVLIWLFTMIYIDNKYEKFVITFLSIICQFLIIATRFHYSSDVVIGGTMSILFFGFYYGIKQCPYIEKYKNRIEYFGFTVLSIFVAVASIYLL